MRRSPRDGRLGIMQAERRGAVRDELGHDSGMPDCAQGSGVGEVTHRSERRVELRRREPPVQNRLGGDHLVPCRR
ncbi:MAG: hypothetical protein M5U19_07450 [Microthrixaceae bacterium]|nr:hypothetical protein [Microthrixaceae bacterium]